MTYDESCKSLESMRRERKAARRAAPEFNPGKPRVPQILEPPLPTTAEPDLDEGDYEIVKPEPLVALTIRKYERAASDKFGYLRRPEDGALAISVTRKSFPRAAWLFDRLIKLLLTHNIEVRVNTTDSFAGLKTNQTFANVDGIDIEISLTYKRHRYRCKTLSSQLRFEVPCGSTVLTVADGRHHRLEDRLPNVLGCLRLQVEGLKKRNNNLLPRPIRPVESAGRIRPHRMQQVEDQQEAGSLWSDLFARQLDGWQEASRIRKFVADIKERAKQREIAIQPGSDLARWLEWADLRADSIDPIDSLLTHASASCRP